MAYFRPSADKARTGKRFLTVRNLEDMAASGVLQVIHTPDLVITDAAREAASSLNITIIHERDQKRASAAALATTPAPANLPVHRVAGQTSAASTSVLASAPAPAPARPAMQGASSVVPMPLKSAPAASSNTQPLVQELVRAVQATWQPSKPRQRQLLT
ncbi:hypothetical protein [Lacisediminimonas sp.]|uniref:hypothetical protein n=1 Tax=Lacisediminimonas sp. TaxID=3060582 RepID=UPI002715C4D9|nr:hypothetical protein [Lacisediminimonas sp.]MDO8298745.1 hypothetical protein [Lacisediminimonas sp.]MDO9216795.1 hypothetical protein [Lacisediminimonas sp.]